MAPAAEEKKNCQLGGHARDPERLQRLPYFLQVSERYKSVLSKTENAEGVSTFR